MADAGNATIPRPVVAGEEMEALKRFHPDVTWQDRIRKGGMGPGTPAQIGEGKLKMTWDASSPDVIFWRNEMTFDGVDWQLIEEYPMVAHDS